MTQKPRRIFTDEQKAETVRIVNQSGRPVIQIAKEMGLTESALRRWIKQAQMAVNMPVVTINLLCSKQISSLV